ncbi:hypothetical protein GCM10009765_27570 [Fodinicola feengrottensis]|uniref:Tetrapyrrole methylase domain-containing protein n=1 Tax=Fodinicola feengrottensis TaxID=435914 RepID=A0ABN2GUB8_9ACTN
MTEVRVVGLGEGPVDGSVELMQAAGTAVADGLACCWAIFAVSHCWARKAPVTANPAITTATTATPSTANGQTVRRSRQVRPEPCRKADPSWRRRNASASSR